MFGKVLIANRGEIALRIHRACREMGIRTVAVHSTADDNAMHVRLADESVCIGPPASRDSYLNIPAILSAAAITGADAIHPGVGFLAENPNFAAMVEEHGFAYIGPSPAHILLMGNKVSAKRAAKEHGIPVVPGSDALADVEAAKAAALRIGYPVLLKAAAGGGGRGMRVARDEGEAHRVRCRSPRPKPPPISATTPCISNAASTGRAMSRFRSLADGQGNVIHLGERDCSLQRNHQKLFEETPSPALNQAERDDLARIATAAIRGLGYKSAGTLEFLYQGGEFFFIEMNTRLQVEHPISEEVSGVDIVREQIRIAAGMALGYAQEDIALSGHAMECRINAEHPDTFLPSPGTITRYHAPGGLGVRVDSAVYQGYAVPPHYDSLIAKLIVHGRTRNECLMRMKRALEEFVIAGIDTTIPLHQSLIVEPDFVNGDYDIHWLERVIGRT